MKRKIVASLLLLGALLPGCARSVTVTPPPQTAVMPEVAKGNELFCLADSEEEAKKIAELYGIELVEFSNGVATFHTEEPLDEVIKRGQDNGWKLLEINSVVHMH